MHLVPPSVHSHVTWHFILSTRLIPDLASTASSYLYGLFLGLLIYFHATCVAGHTEISSFLLFFIWSVIPMPHELWLILFHATCMCLPHCSSLTLLIIDRRRTDKQRRHFQSGALSIEYCRRSLRVKQEPFRVQSGTPSKAGTHNHVHLSVSRVR